MILPTLLLYYVLYALKFDMQFFILLDCSMKLKYLRLFDINVLLIYDVVYYTFLHVLQKLMNWE